VRISSAVERPKCRLRFGEFGHQFAHVLAYVCSRYEDQKVLVLSRATPLPRLEERVLTVLKRDGLACSGDDEVAFCAPRVLTLR
jgi:hypothetical protein